LLVFSVQVYNFGRRARTVRTHQHMDSATQRGKKMDLSLPIPSSPSPATNLNLPMNNPPTGPCARFCMQLLPAGARGLAVGHPALAFFSEGPLPPRSGVATASKPFGYGVLNFLDPAFWVRVDPPPPRVPPTLGQGGRG